MGCSVPTLNMVSKYWTVWCGIPNTGEGKKMDMFPAPHSSERDDKYE